MKASLKVRHTYVSYNLCVCRPKMSVKTGSNAHEAKSGKQLVVYTNHIMCVYTYVYTCSHTQVNTKIYLLSLDLHNPKLGMKSHMRETMQLHPKNQPNLCLLRYTWKQAMTDAKNEKCRDQDCEKHLAASANVTVLWKWSADLQALHGHSVQNMLPSIKKDENSIKIR